MNDQPRCSTAMAKLLPPQCVSYEVTTGAANASLAPEATLFADEQAIIAQADRARRSEFAAVRLCARQALADLGSGPYPLLPGRHGAPRWPPGFVGSMTHSRGLAVAAVARSRDVRALGIDAEPHLPLPREVVARVVMGAERRHLADLENRNSAVCWDRLLFCAKEAVYKVWSPLTGKWLGFHDAQVDLEQQPGDQGRGTVAVHLQVPGPLLEGGYLDTLQGRWALADGVILVAVWLPAAPEGR